MPLSTLKSSKYAPKTPLESLAQSKAEKLKQDKIRATRLLGRLRWKAESLVASYFRAMEIYLAETDHNGNLDRRGRLRYAFIQDTNSVNYYHPYPITKYRQRNADLMKRQAESMFKVDFFEFYTLLERYITVCLGIVGVNVSADAPRTNVNALRYLTNPDLQQTRPFALHAFHANLLEALDDEGCPLHASLGVQEVRIQLGLAKDFRNAWKDADEHVLTSGKHTRNDEDRKKLPELDLDTMLRLLLLGSEHAHTVVQNYDGQGLNGVTSQDFEPQSHSHTGFCEEDIPFEYMDDAMDLD